MDLINAMQTQYSSSKRALTFVIWLGIAQFLLVILSFFAPLKGWPFCVAIAMFFIQVTMFFLRYRSQTKFGFAEEIRRAALLNDGLGRNLPAFELARLDLRVGASKNREPPIIRAYYSSSLPVGPRRLLESFHESVYFTSYLAETSMLIFGGLAIGGAAAAAIAAILLFGSGLVTTEVTSLAQIGIAAMAFFAAGDMLQMALGYRGLKLATDGLLRSCDTIREQSSPSLDVVTNLTNEYGIALIQSPVILSPVYKARQKRIQETWDKHLKSL